MAATVLSAVTSHLDRGVYKVVVIIPTTVDAVSGATADFTLSRVFAISFQTKSTDYNGKAVSLQASNDDVNFFALPTPKSNSSDDNLAVAPSECAFQSYRVTINGAPLAPITVTIIANVHP
jgi:hypothetical protein